MTAVIWVLNDCIFFFKRGKWTLIKAGTIPVCLDPEVHWSSIGVANSTLLFSEPHMH